MSSLSKQIALLFAEVLRSAISHKDVAGFPYRIISSENRSLTLSADAAKPYDLICKKLLQTKDTDKKFSEKFIQKKIDPLIVDSVNHSHEVIEKSIDSLLKELQAYQVKQEIILPIEGLRLHTDKFELGNVIFIKKTENSLNEIYRRVDNAINATKNTDQEKALISNTLHSRLNEAFQSEVFATYSVIAEPFRARERAVEECGKSLDLLRFATPYLFPHSENVGVGLKGELISTQSLSLAFSEDGSLNSNHFIVGSYIPFELSDDKNNHLERIGVFKLSELLKKDSSQLSDFEERILSSIHWCARAQTQILPEFRLLCLVTSLESVLNPRGDRPLRMGIAEGVALLITKDLDKRREIRDFLLDIYDKRSKVSHGGHPEMIDHELKRLTIITGALIFELLKKVESYNKQDELLSWLDDQRLA